MDFLEEIFGRRGHRGRKHHEGHEDRRHDGFHSPDAGHCRSDHHVGRVYVAHRDYESEHDHHADRESGWPHHRHDEGGRHWVAELPDDRRWTPLAQFFRSKSVVVLLVIFAVALLGAIIAVLVVLLPLAGELLGFVGEHGIRGIIDKVWNGSA